MPRRPAPVPTRQGVVQAPRPAVRDRLPEVWPEADLEPGHLAANRFCQLARAEAQAGKVVDTPGQLGPASEELSDTPTPLAAGAAKLELCRAHLSVFRKSYVPLMQSSMCIMGSIVSFSK